MSFFSHGMARNRLEILYFLYITDFELTSSALLSALMEITDGDYFAYATALDELANNMHVAVVTRAYGQCYCISEQGRYAIKEFMEELPLSVRNRIDDFAKKNEQRLLSGCHLGTSTKKVGDGQYMVTLTIVEGEMVLFKLDLNVSSSTVASAICTRFEDSSPALYKTVFEILTKGAVLE